MLNSGVQIIFARCLWLVLAAAVLPGCRALFPTDGERFERAGVQVGQPLPEVDLTSLDGHTHPWASAWGDRPAVFIAVSRSCPVARYRMMDVRLLRDTFGEQVKLVLVYTVEAHPDQDPSPYRDDGKPWLTPFNRVEGVRIRQPQTLDARRTRRRPSLINTRRVLRSASMGWTTRRGTFWVWAPTWRCWWTIAAWCGRSTAGSTAPRCATRSSPYWRATEPPR